MHRARSLSCLGARPPATCAERARLLRERLPDRDVELTLHEAQDAVALAFGEFCIVHESLAGESQEVLSRSHEPTRARGAMSLVEAREFVDREAIDGVLAEEVLFAVRK